MAERRRTVAAAVRADLKKLDKRAGAKRGAAISTSTLAATALALAAELDDRDNSATSKAQCARRLMEAMDRLQDRANAQQEGDRVDELATRRRRRRKTATSR